MQVQILSWAPLRIGLGAIGPESFFRFVQMNGTDSGQHRVEENLRLLERGRLKIPPDTDPMIVLLSDGRLEQQPKRDRPLTFEMLVEQYRIIFRNERARLGSMSENFT